MNNRPIGQRNILTPLTRTMLGFRILGVLPPLPFLAWPKAEIQFTLTFCPATNLSEGSGSGEMLNSGPLP
jgi:hypothetical protein